MSLDVALFVEQFLGSAKINICGDEIVQGLVVTFMDVIIHETSNLHFQVGGEIIVL